MDAYLAGLLYGDGTFYKGKNRAYSVWIDQNNKNIAIIVEAAKKFKQRNLRVYQYGFLDKTRALVYSKPLFLLFVALRKSPVAIFSNYSEIEKWDFISGFFDAEGTVTDRVVIYNGHLQLLETIKKFLTSQGVVCHLYKFGKIYGVQIYQRKSIEILRNQMCGVKIKKTHSLKLTNVAGC